MSSGIDLFTIGFTKKSAEQFFERLRANGVKRIVDVRLNNDSQLAGFSKRRDLEYFLRTILGIEYVHLPALAPTKAMLTAYKKHGGDWSAYEQEFLALMEKRRVQDTMARDILHQGCLLCSEHEPHHCHRRLVAEYLTRHWGNIRTTHIT